MAAGAHRLNPLRTRSRSELARQSRRRDARHVPSGSVPGVDQSRQVWKHDIWGHFGVVHILVPTRPGQDEDRRQASALATRNVGCEIVSDDRNSGTADEQ